MNFRDDAVSQSRPDALTEVMLPRRQHYHPSPAAWRDQILYFLLVDRFSDGVESARPLLDRTDVGAARPQTATGRPWQWILWARSGAERFQGGTLAGVLSKLDYLRDLGVTALWLSPVMRQRDHLDTYHGYGVADFLEVDPRFGSRKDLLDLVDEAHRRQMYVILDVIFNHTGHNWNYPGDVAKAPYRPWPEHYDFGAWLGVSGEPVSGMLQDGQGVWPAELQDSARYTRAGTGDLSAGDVAYPHAENKRTDFEDLRDLATDVDPTLEILASVYQYWIALTDCDGFRIDTVKHVSLEEARNFCGAIKEYALAVGKENFLLIGEVAGGNGFQDFYLDGLPRNLDAVLDIGEARPTLELVGKGLADPAAYFDGFNALDAGMGTHRAAGDRHVSVLNDHDHVIGPKVRITPDLSFDHQAVVPIAIQLFTLGIPCIYYGTEQALAPPEESQRPYLPEFGTHDRYLREALFGPLHPRRAGLAGLPPAAPDPDLPGFGPFGTAGHHCFDSQHPCYRRIAALAAVRRDLPVLRHGRQYLRPLDIGGTLTPPSSGGLFGWSRILGNEEALVVANTNGIHPAPRTRVLVDAKLNQADGTMTVIANTAQSANPAAFAAPHPVGTTVPIEKDLDESTFITIGSLGPSEVIVLLNHPDPEAGTVNLHRQ
jgi:glycosidase